MALVNVPIRLSPRGLDLFTMSNNRKHRYMSGAALLALGGLALGAAPASAADAPAPDPDAGGSRVEEVTVYARKRAENVQTVPVPVTVLTTQQLARQIWSISPTSSSSSRPSPST